MSSVENKTVLQQAIARWNQGDLAGYLELYSPQVVLHGYPPGLPAGVEGANLFYQGIWAAFSGSQLAVDEVIEDDDRMACRYTLRAIHSGDFLGIPPTGKEITLPGLTIFYFHDGKCVERWNQADMLGLMQQLGAMKE
jgi:steroid delta-isomerase-like uncharacterized protein